MSKLFFEMTETEVRNIINDYAGLNKEISFSFEIVELKTTGTISRR